MSGFGPDFHKRVVVGLEVEAYSIDTSVYRIGRRLSRPRPGLSESGERFTRDASIGSEYNSRPFVTAREALFLLKSGLRKYLRDLDRSRRAPPGMVPLLAGAWTDRVAGVHLHLSLAGHRLTRAEAASLARHLHAHIPLLIAVGANSPVWGRKITGRASMRLLRGSDAYFTPVRRGQISSVSTREMLYSPGRKTKPPTLELRVLDSNAPDFIVACLCLAKAVALRWSRRGRPGNLVSQTDYLRGRVDAAFRGTRARLSWRGRWLSAPAYLDRFLREYREELEAMDVPDEVFEVLRLFKRGFNGARILHDAAVAAREEHPQTWQRRFAKRYERALRTLLSGNSLRDFAAALLVELPSTESVWLGRRGGTLGR